MNGRRHGSKPTIALWMLIAIADLALLVAAIGAVTVLLIVAGLFALAGGVLAARALPRRSVGASKTVVRPRV